ncbi:MAG: zinc-ribbon domain-containing protein [Asgard group archaeon]
MIVSKFVSLINNFKLNENHHHDDGMFGFSWWGWMVIMMGFWLFIGILLGVWVYHDAKDRGENGALWLIIVLFTMLIGLIIWLIVRPEKQVPKSETREKTKEVVEKVLICPYCKTENPPDSNFCVNCGASLG